MVNKALLAAVVLVVLPCCQKKTDTPATPLGSEGDVCKVGDRVTRQCRSPLTCTLQPYAPPNNPPGVHGPEAPSDVGGACGGVAGFHCADGLECAMSAEQERVADGMGACARASKCTH